MRFFFTLFIWFHSIWPTVVLLVSLFSISFHFNLYFADKPNERFIRRPTDYVCELMFYVLTVPNILKICKFVLTVGDLFVRSHNFVKDYAAFIHMIFFKFCRI
jgi:hypothetical protein